VGARSHTRTVAGDTLLDVAERFKLGFDAISVKDIIGCEYRPEKALYLIPVGDLYSNDRREFTVELVVPPGTGSVMVASGTMRYTTEYARLREMPQFNVKIHYTHDVVEIERNRDLDTQAKTDIAVSTRRVERAMQAVDEGRVDDAANELREAKSALMASPAASAQGAASGDLRRQAEKMEEFDKLLKDSTDTRRAKKAIQYENYKTQKNKK